MATLSEDNDSWSAGGVIRRDFRNSRGSPEIPKPQHSRHKDTKRWCKGIEGRDHVIGVKPISPHLDWMCDYCTVCEKVLHWHERVLIWRVAK